MRAIQHRDLVQLHALIAQLQNPLRDKLRLLPAVLERHQRRLQILPLPRRAQLLLKLLHVRRDGRIRHCQHLRHAPVVQLDLEDLRIRIPLRKREDVFKIRAAPRVDRLRIIAHHHQVAMLARQRVDEVRLDLVRILILVHEDELKLPPIETRHLRMLLQHPQRLLQQVVEIHRVRRLLLLLVARVHPFDLLQQRQEIRELLRQHLVHRPLRVDRETEEIRQHIRLREPNLLRINPRTRHHRRDQIPLILPIQNREPARITEHAPMPPQHPVADGVKRPAPKPARIHRQQIRHPIEHLPRRLVREGQEQNVPRVHPILEQVSHAISQRPRLPRPRARDHQERPRRSRHRRMLLRIQLRRIINPNPRRRRSALENILARHGAISVAADDRRRNFDARRTLSASPEPMDSLRSPPPSLSRKAHRRAWPASNGAPAPRPRNARR